MKYCLAAFIVLAVTGNARADLLLCEAEYYALPSGPHSVEITVTLDHKKGTARTSSDIGWVEGPITASTEHYTGQLRAKSGELRSFLLDRYTGEMTLINESTHKVVSTAKCRKAEPKF